MSFAEKAKLRDLSGKPVSTIRSSRSPTPSHTPEGSSHSQQSFHSNSFDAARPTKRERRSKDHSNQRNYICGCGKSYLSYAALYTHAKTKHDGVFPEGTTTLHKKKQGRPKKDEWFSSRVNSELQKFYDFHKNFVGFLDMIPEAREEREEAKKDLLESFPSDLFASPEICEKLKQNFENIAQELTNTHGSFLNQIDSILIEISSTKRLTCNEIFAYFLLYVFRLTSTSFFKEVVFFMLTYQKVANQYGWQILKQFNEELTLDVSTDFCENQGPEILPLLSNELINSCFLKHLKGQEILANPGSLVYFGSDAVKIIRLILLVKHFLNWINIHGFTKERTEVNL